MAKSNTCHFVRNQEIINLNYLFKGLKNILKKYIKIWHAVLSLNIITQTKNNLFYLSIFL